MTEEKEQPTHVLVPIEWVMEQIHICKERQSWTSDTRIYGIYEARIDSFKELLQFKKVHINI